MIRLKNAYEKYFCVGGGYSPHVDITRAQKRQVAVSHVKLQAWKVPVVLGEEARVCVAQYVLDPTAFKTGSVAYFAPVFLPICGAYMRIYFRFSVFQDMSDGAYNGLGVICPNGANRSRDAGTVSGGFTITYDMATAE